MKEFGAKLKQCRARSGLNQQQLAERTGISKRSIAAYEAGTAHPRGDNARKLATALEVSSDYLLTDGIEDFYYGMDKLPYVEEIRERFGRNAAKEMDRLLEENRALFAGGTLDQDSKDMFFEAVMRAYIVCKEEARRRYGRSAEPEKQDDK